MQANGGEATLWTPLLAAGGIALAMCVSGSSLCATSGGGSSEECIDLEVNFAPGVFNSAPVCGGEELP
ncbi:hypothetical protein [Solemya pervernicosa gill symbiont]|nr:hypothetical protein [Solemya pervernicosa gill symbiont]